jgi:hypothetical protein
MRNHDPRSNGAEPDSECPRCCIRLAAKAARSPPGEQQNAAETVAAELEQQEVEKRRIVDRQQRFWCVGGECAEPGTKPAAQNDGLPDHPGSRATTVGTRGKSLSSTRPKIMCAAVMCSCWMIAVESDAVRLDARGAARFSASARPDRLARNGARRYNPG